MVHVWFVYTTITNVPWEQAPHTQTKHFRKVNMIVEEEQKAIDDLKLTYNMSMHSGLISKWRINPSSSGFAECSAFFFHTEHRWPHSCRPDTIRPTAPGALPQNCWVVLFSLSPLLEFKSFFNVFLTRGNENVSASYPAPLIIPCSARWQCQQGTPAGQPVLFWFVER